MNIYDSTLNIWNLNVSPLTGVDRVLPILAYSATFLDGLILYIGGRSGTVHLWMKIIVLMNTPLIR